jgi:hypothetical protein
MDRAENVSTPVAIRRHSGLPLRAGLALLTAAALAACAPQPAPRTVLDFMDDGLARDGALNRCNQDRDATLADVECANARRAAAIVALEGERARVSALERESADKLVALRQRQERQSVAEQSTAAAALAAAEANYEARWRNPSVSRPADGAASGAAPAYGVPVGQVMPSMTESALFDVYAEGADPLGRRTIELASAEPPSKDLKIEAPELELHELSIIPRPFRDASEPARQ